MSLNGGDALARGAKSAQFSTHTELSEFEYDLSTGMDNDELKKKYGLSEVEIDNYRERRGNGERIDISPVHEQSLTDGIEVIDRRSVFLNQEEVKAVEKPAPKFKEKTYTKPTTLLDRVLIKRIVDDPDLELLQDGTVRSKKTGFIIPQAYRQHNNVGIVLAVGQFVIMGGLRIPMEELVKPGDKVKYGDYNSEVFVQDESVTREMCDAVGMNYEEDPEGLRVVRVQDIRTIQRPVEDTCLTD